MPQPTMPAAVRMEQYCPLSQRLLMPMARPCSNCRSRRVVRGMGSLMKLLRRCAGCAPVREHRRGRGNCQGAEKLRLRVSGSPVRAASPQAGGSAKRCLALAVVPGERIDDLHRSSADALAEDALEDR